MDLVSFESADEYRHFAKIMYRDNITSMWTSGRKCNFRNKGCESSSLQPVNINGWFWADGNKRIPATNTPSRQTFWSGTGQGGQRQPDNFEGLQAGSLNNVKDDTGMTVEGLQEWYDEACLIVHNNKYKDGVQWHDEPCFKRGRIICEDSELQMERIKSEAGVDVTVPLSEKRGGMGGGKKVVVEPHRHAGVFIARGKEDALVTKNMVMGESVYGEKRIAVEDEAGKIEYRVWNPFRSKLAAAILGGVDAIHMPPGSKVLYLGAASGTTVSHVSDVVGPEGMVYAVEFSHRSGRDLLNMAKKRTNVVPIIEDARHPHKYRMLVPMVDCVFADVAQPDQGRIVALNSQFFLKNGGNFVISIKANCIDSTAEPEAVFAGEVKKMQAEKMKPQEQVTLEPYERDHAVVVGIYRAPPKA